ncbi:MAG: ATP-binding protein [Candidatus Uhrbacteria bacterium]
MALIERKLAKKIRKYLTSPEAVVITGMRRVGKTTLVEQMLDEIRDAHSDNILTLDLENPVNQQYFDEENYDAIWYTFEKLGMRGDERSFVFLDEVQYVKNIPSVVKYLSDHRDVKFFLTGSASFYIKNTFTQSLAGRKVVFDLFPFDFEEFLALKEMPEQVPEQVKNSALHSHFTQLYREYIEFGGFPMVIQKTSHEEKIKALEDIFTSYYQKDVLAFGDFRNNQAVRDLMLLLMQRIGSKLDETKLAKELGITRPTVKEYLAFLEATYMFQFVRPFTKNPDVEIRSTPKVYCIDSGFVNHFGKLQLGHVFENAIFHQLRVRGEKIQYYQRKSGDEIDFIVNEQHAYEVKTHATPQHQAAFQKLAKSIGMQDTNIVSLEYAPDAEAIYGFQL